MYVLTVLILRQRDIDKHNLYMQTRYMFNVRDTGRGPTALLSNQTYSQRRICQQAVRKFMWRPFNSNTSKCTCFLYLSPGFTLPKQLFSINCLCLKLTKKIIPTHKLFQAISNYKRWNWLYVSWMCVSKVPCALCTSTHENSGVGILCIYMI